MFLRYEWRQKRIEYSRDYQGRLRQADVSPKREIVLRENSSSENHQYDVSFSAQHIAGRHARTVETKSFSSLQTAKDYILEMAKKYGAPQTVIDEIIGDVKGV